MFGVDAEAHVDLDGFVELAEFDFLYERNGFLERVRPFFDLLRGSLILLPWFMSHQHLTGSNGPLEKGPPIVLHPPERTQFPPLGIAPRFEDWTR